MIIFSDQERAKTTTPQQRIFNVVAGELIVSDERGLLLQSTLGSCISACIHDPIMKIGGMNHISLPQNRNEAHEGFLYGSSLMEKMINEAIKLGATKKNMVFKVFGGAKIIESPSNVGWLNIGFVYDFLQTEGYKITSSHVGDVLPRMVKFTPQTGKVLLKQLAPEEHESIDRASAYTKSENKVELFN